MIDSLLQGSTKVKPLLLIGSLMAVVLIVAIGVIIYLKKRRQGGEFGVQGPSSMVMAQTFAAVLQGKESFDLLASIVFDALRLGNFSEYRGAFVSQAEIATYFDHEEAATITSQLKEENLRPAFERMRALYLKDRGDLIDIESHGERTATSNKTETDDAKIIQQVRLKLVADEKEYILEVGSFIHVPLGWKLLLPPSRMKVDENPSLH